MTFLIRTCLRNCLESRPFYPSNVVPPNKKVRPIHLDQSFSGHEVVLIKELTRVCGSGGVLGNAPLVQNKSYFEVKVQQSGTWSIGVALRDADLNNASGGTDLKSWVLRQDCKVWHESKVLHELNARVSEGDVIGVSYDHTDMHFYLNGVCLHCPVSGIRGTVYPILYGAILNCSTTIFLLVRDGPELKSG